MVKGKNVIKGLFGCEHKKKIENMIIYRVVERKGQVI